MARLWTPGLSPRRDHKFHGGVFTGYKRIGRPWWLPLCDRTRTPNCIRKKNEIPTVLGKCDRRPERQTDENRRCVKPPLRRDLIIQILEDLSVACRARRWQSSVVRPKFGYNDVDDSTTTCLLRRRGTATTDGHGRRDHQHPSTTRSRRRLRAVTGPVADRH